MFVKKQPSIKYKLIYENILLLFNAKRVSSFVMICFAILPAQFFMYFSFSKSASYLCSKWTAFLWSKIIQKLFFFFANYFEIAKYFITVKCCKVKSCPQSFFSCIDISSFIKENAHGFYISLLRCEMQWS